MSDSEDLDDELFFADEEEENTTINGNPPWKILVVDDDEEIHHITKIVLGNVSFLDRPFEFTNTFSAQETINFLEKEHHQIALILLDVVMESDEAGFQVIRYLRETLQNKQTRIILRTGQPGQAPEEKVILEYDIQDYKAKTELTSQKLFTSVISALRSYQDIQTIQKNQVALRIINNASNSIFKIQSIEDFAEKALDSFIKILLLDKDITPQEGLALCYSKKTNSFQILNRNLFSFDHTPELPKYIIDLCQKAKSKQTWIYDEECLVLYFEVEQQNKDHFFIFEKIPHFSEWDQNMIELLSNNILVALNNLYLNHNLRELNGAYQRFVPHDFLKFLEKNSILDVHVGDYIDREMSVLVADINSFSALSKSMTSEENFKFINSYLSKMRPMIQQNNGYIDKFMGDTIMALFDQSSDNAVCSAIQMIEYLKDYNGGRKRAGYQPLEVSIGLHKGQVLLGTIALAERMDGIVISETVNIADRLEELCKLFSVSILISDTIYQQLTNPEKYCIRKIDQVTSHANHTSIPVYEVYEHNSDLEKKEKKKIDALFQEGLKLYQEKKYKNALMLFQECESTNPSDPVIQVYQNRCKFMTTQHSSSY
ncbi:MAG: class 3 adenylate cyclase/CheY-like chemotaxis protein [bacterium]|jgi:class 3 adenylate cyclase/CheY-like chemotaxis protein